MILEDKAINIQMRRNKREIGTVYEQRVGRYLETQGYEILHYNFRCRIGEIDIIAKDKEYIVFCEVKFRSKTGTGNPMEAVDSRKQRVISKCALYYLTQHHMTECACRFDVISVLGDEITVIKNAFDYSG